jgi:hypothetical protein
LKPVRKSKDDGLAVDLVAREDGAAAGRRRGWWETRDLAAEQGGVADREEARPRGEELAEGRF